MRLTTQDFCSIQVNTYVLILLLHFTRECQCSYVGEGFHCHIAGENFKDASDLNGDLNGQTLIKNRKIFKIYPKPSKT